MNNPETRSWPSFRMASIGRSNVQGTSSARETTVFHLLRYFSLTSAVVLLTAALLLAAVYRHVTVQQLVDHGETANVALAGAVANSIWPDFAMHLASAGDKTRDELRADPETLRLRQAVLNKLHGLSVVKVKIYDRSGLTVFSTQESQIGDDKSTNAGFLSAISGRVASELTHRDTFSAFENVIEHRDVISSYIPIRSADGQIEGVFEIYDDVTSLLTKIDQTQIIVVATSALILVLIYFVLYLVVRRADIIIKQQHHDILSSRAQLADKNETLESEIEERIRAEKSLHTLNRELRLSQEQTELASRSKSEFLANMSHELRTPLNAIIGFSAMIQEQTFGPVGNAKYVGYVSDINHAGHHLLELINDILDLSKIEVGRLDLHDEVLDISAIIRTCARLVAERASAIGSHLDLALPDDIPPLRADSRMVKQILLNLLSNAIKFTPAGGRICVRLRFDAGEGHVIEVADTGIGIAPQDIATAMETFGQVDSALNRKYDGAGLGLPLSRSLVELHGGSLSLDSDVGVGTTVTIRFPLERSHPFPTSSVAAANQPASREIARG